MSALPTAVVTALCTAGCPFGSEFSCFFVLLLLLFLNPLENKSYTSVRTEALSVIQLLLTRLQGETLSLLHERIAAV